MVWYFDRPFDQQKRDDLVDVPAQRLIVRCPHKVLKDLAEQCIPMRLVQQLLVYVLTIRRQYQRRLIWIAKGGGGEMYVKQRL